MKIRGFLISHQINSLLFIVALFLSLSLPIYATNWYVYKNASGSNNGTSWNNAWQSFSAINWNLIQPGDVIFISGGQDSVIYHESITIGASGSWNNYVYVMAGRYASNSNGHSGRVIFDGDSVRSTVVTINGRQWVYIKGLETRHATGRGWNIVGSTRHIVIDSVKNYEHSDHHMAIIGNAWGDSWIGDNDSTTLITDIEIKNCTMYGYKNHNNPGDDDMIIIDAAQQLNIHDNFLHIQNQQIGVPIGQHKHLDPLQTLEVKNVKIWNNVCIVDSGCYGHTMILGMQSGTGGIDTNIIYNNYLYGGGHLAPGGNPSVPELYLRWYGYGAYPPTFIINNTIVSANGGSYPIYHERPAWVKNNIIVQYGTNGQNPANYGGAGRPTWQGGYNTSWYNDADYSGPNLMWRDYSGVEFGGNRFRGVGGSPIGTPSSWSTWVNAYGATGINSNPLFINNVRESNGYIISSNSPAVNAGSDLQAFIESKGLPWADIEGNPRDSSPDLGAYESDYLPVELTSFTATSQFGIISLNWVTATETNNLGFEIERKLDDSEWERIGFVEGNGTTLEPNEYSYIDDIRTFQVTSLVYRLKQIDFSGSFEYSNVVEIQLTPVQFELSQNYPNPFNPSTKIKYSIPVPSLVTLKVYDVLGNEVAILVNEEKPIGNYEINFSNVGNSTTDGVTYDLSSGVYIYRLQAGNFIESRKMILMK